MLQVLLLCDDFWHPGEVITRGLRHLSGFAALDVVTRPKDILTVKMLDDYDVIVNARSDVHSPANKDVPWFEEGVAAVMPRDFRAWVERGGGFLALHSGNTYNATRMPEMADLTGNYFIGHPAQCVVHWTPRADHPICRGVEPFSGRDEHYMIDVMCSDADVFLTGSSDSEAGTQVAGYTRLPGKGRFCALTPGHNCAVLEEENFARLTRNALAWCAGKL